MPGALPVPVARAGGRRGAGLHPAGVREGAKPLGDPCRGSPAPTRQAAPRLSRNQRQDSPLLTRQTAATTTSAPKTEPGLATTVAAARTPEHQQVGSSTLGRWRARTCVHRPSAPARPSRAPPAPARPQQHHPTPRQAAVQATGAARRRVRSSSAGKRRPAETNHRGPQWSTEVAQPAIGGGGGRRARRPPRRGSRRVHGLRRPRARSPTSEDPRPPPPYASATPPNTTRCSPSSGPRPRQTGGLGTPSCHTYRFTPAGRGHEP